MCGDVLDVLSRRRNPISACRRPDYQSANKGEIEEVCGRGELEGPRGAIRGVRMRRGDTKRERENKN